MSDWINYKPSEVKKMIKEKLLSLKQDESKPVFKIEELEVKEN